MFFVRCKKRCIVVDGFGLYVCFSKQAKEAYQARCTETDKSRKECVSIKEVPNLEKVCNFLILLIFLSLNSVLRYHL